MKIDSASFASQPLEWDPERPDPNRADPSRDRGRRPALTVTSYNILKAIAATSTGVASRSQLSERLGMPKATIAHAVQRLEAQGYLINRPSRTDDRMVLAVITTIGRQLVMQPPE